MGLPEVIETARKKDSSFQDLTLEKREEKWVGDQQDATNESGRKDRAQLLSLVRGAPNWQEALCGIKRDANMTDAELTRTIGLLDAPRDTLRLAGLKHEAVLLCLRLLPSALSYDPHFARRTSSKSCCGRIKLRHRITAILLITAVALAVSSVLILFFTRQGWTDGVCKIKQFWNATLDTPCTGNCVFNIEIRSGALLVMKTAWEPQREMDVLTKDISFVGAPFRCCSTSGTLNCCEFMEETTMDFCDNWPHRLAPDGTACPAGNWPCMFKLDPSDEKVVLELKPEDDSPMTKNLFLAAAVVAGAALFVTLTSFLWRGFMACLRFSAKRFGGPDPDSMKKLSDARRASLELANGPKRNSQLTQMVQVQVQAPAEPLKILAVRQDSISSEELAAVGTRRSSLPHAVPPSEIDDQMTLSPVELLEPVAVGAEASPGARGTSAPPAAATRYAEEDDVNGALYDKRESNVSRKDGCSRGPKTLFDLWQKESTAGATGGKSGHTITLRELAAQAAESEWGRPIITPPHSQQGMHSSRRARSTHRGATGTSRPAHTADQAALRSRDISGASTAGPRVGSRNPRGSAAADDPRSWGWALQSNEVDSTHVIDISGSASPHGSWVTTSPSRSSHGSPSRKRTLAHPQALNPLGTTPRG